MENKEDYFLFYISLEAIIVPKRFIKDTEQVLFQQILSQYLSFDAEVGHFVKS